MAMGSIMGMGSTHLLVLTQPNLTQSPLKVNNEEIALWICVEGNDSMNNGDVTHGYGVHHGYGLNHGYGFHRTRTVVL